ncbi:hypothetical protein ElyMa_005849700, partial [Elysia marginata]
MNIVGFKPAPLAGTHRLARPSPDEQTPLLSTSTTIETLSTRTVSHYALYRGLKSRPAAMHEKTRDFGAVAP